jgi:taurine transport system permease protein
LAVRHQCTSAFRLVSSIGRTVDILVFGSLVLIWWFVATYVVADPVLLPDPREVAARAWTLLSPNAPLNLSLWPDVAASATRVYCGWAGGLLSGVVVGVVMASSSFVRSAFDPLLQGIRSVPPLAWAPLLVIWLGIGESSKIFLLLMTAMPILAISTMAAIAGVDESFRRAALTLGASPFYMMRRVILPASLPEILTSARITLGLTWSSLIAAELIGSTEGIGYRILRASRVLDTSTIFVGIIIIAAFAYFGDAALRLLSRMVVPWKGRA